MYVQMRGGRGLLSRYSGIQVCGEDGRRTGGTLRVLTLVNVLCWCLLMDKMERKASMTSAVLLPGSSNQFRFVPEMCGQGSTLCSYIFEDYVHDSIIDPSFGRVKNSSQQTLLLQFPYAH